MHGKWRKTVPLVQFRVGEDGIMHKSWRYSAKEVGEMEIWTIPLCESVKDGIMMKYKGVVKNENSTFVAK